MPREDVRFYKVVEGGIVHLEDQHYEMPLPLKDQNVKLLNNHTQAEKRLNNKWYHTDYCNLMSETISKGYACKANDDPKPQTGGLGICRIMVFTKLIDETEYAWCLNAQPDTKESP